MRVSLNWLQEFAPISGSPAAIASRIAQCSCNA